LLSVLTIGLPTISALNNTCYTDQQTGTDLGLRIAACQAVLSTAGGIINATGETGAQSAAATITLSKPVTLMLGNYNLTLNGNPGINMNAVGASIIGLGRNQSVITAGANNDLIRTSAGAEIIDNLELEGFGLASNILIHVVGGGSEKFDRIYANNSGGTALQFEATEGVSASVTNSLLQPMLSSTPAFTIHGNDGCGGGTAMPRHFVNIDTGGRPVDIQGANTVMLSNSFISGITMTSSACKLLMTGNRITNNNVTFSGTNQNIVGNTFAGSVTLDNTFTSGVYSENIDAGLTNNSIAPNLITSVYNPPQTKRAMGCTTSGGATPFSGPCTVTVTWSTTFTDNHYTPVCVGQGVGAGTPVLQVLAGWTAATIGVQTQQATGIDASFQNIFCIAVHD